LILPRLYPILDTALLENRACPLHVAAGAMLDSGAAILQIRHKGVWSRRLVEQAGQVARLCQQARALLVINDRADIAMLLGAGLHLGQDDLPPSDARRLIGPAALLGFSTHNSGQIAAAAAEPVDYLAFGPMFPTRSKANPDPVVGVDGLSACRRLTARPLVAIGGVTRGNAPQVLAAGADSLAVISDLLPADCSAAAIAERIRDWHRTIG
jgi:thiamine-phosphate pyrophosphorylase